MWASIRKFEVWRLVTPIFIHYGLMHIVLNMIWLYSFGAPIEDRRGSLFLLLLVLVLAITSNIGQAIEVGLRESGALFGGMSGVGYGLFAYMAYLHFHIGDALAFSHVQRAWARPTGLPPVFVWNALTSFPKVGWVPTPSQQLAVAVLTGYALSIVLLVKSASAWRSTR